MNDQYLYKLIENQNRILQRQAEALEKIATDKKELQFAIAKTEQALCPRDDEKLNSVRPLARLIAEMIERSYWAHSGIKFEADGAAGQVFFRVGSSSPVSVSGYGFAYQVKLCMDLFADCGYFM